jgi:hypothetical protein
VALVVFVIGCTSGTDEFRSSTPPTTSSAPVEEPRGPATTTESPRVDATTEDGLALPVGEDPETLGPLGESTQVLQTEEGAIEIGAGTVPANVPSVFPIPEDFVVEISSIEGTAAGFSGRSEFSFDELVEFYVNGLEAAGFEIVEQRLVSGSVAVYSFTGPDGDGSIAISGAPGGGQSLLVTFES